MKFLLKSKFTFLLPIDFIRLIKIPFTLFPADSVIGRQATREIWCIFACDVQPLQNLRVLH